MPTELPKLYFCKGAFGTIQAFFNCSNREIFVVAIISWGIFISNKM